MESLGWVAVSYKRGTPVGRETWEGCETEEPLPPPAGGRVALQCQANGSNVCRVLRARLLEGYEAQGTASACM